MVVPGAWRKPHHVGRRLGPTPRVGAVASGQLQVVGGLGAWRSTRCSSTATFTSLPDLGAVCATETQDGSWRVRVPPGTYRVTASQTRRPSWRTAPGATLYGSSLQASPIRFVVEPDHPVSGVVLAYNVR